MSLGQWDTLVSVAHRLSPQDLDDAVARLLEQQPLLLMRCNDSRCSRIRDGRIRVTTWNSLAERRHAGSESWIRHTHPFCPRCGRPGSPAERADDDRAATHVDVWLDP